MKFQTTNNHTFELSIPAFVLSAEQADALKSAIMAGIEQEEPTARKDLLTAVVSAVNREFKTMATMSAMLSDDVLSTLCNGLQFGKLSLSREGDSVIINYDVAMRSVCVGKVDKTPVYENRPDFVQYADVMRMFSAYNKQLKKEGYKEGYTLKGAISAQQFNLLTVFCHNLSGKLTDKDRERLEKLGENFASFASDSNTKRLECVQFFYNLFNAHTGNDYKAIGFVVNELKNDKRLATFDSQHYISTVPGEYTLLSVLISHYVNTGRKVLEKSKARAIGTVKADQ